MLPEFNSHFVRRSRRDNGRHSHMLSRQTSAACASRTGVIRGRLIKRQFHLQLSRIQRSAGKQQSVHRVYIYIYMYERAQEAGV